MVGHNGFGRARTLASGTAQALTRRFRERGGALLSPRSAAVAELVLAGAIGVIALFLVRSLFAPTPIPTPERFPAPPPHALPSATDKSVIENPFATPSDGGEAPPADEGPEFAETTLDLFLHGTWVDENGGAAIIKTPDGDQKRFSTGEEIWDGVRLERVYRDQVIIVTAGVRESLRLENREAALFESAPAASAAGGPPQSARSEGGGQALLLGNAVRVIPQRGEKSLQFALYPGADARQFAAMGLRPGDILIAVENRRIGEEMAADEERLRELASRSSVSIVIERDGVALPINLNLSHSEAIGINED